MSEVQFSREMRAFEAFQKWLEQAATVQELFESAGLGVPAPLARTLGLSEHSPARRREPQMMFSPMESPARPPEAEPDWIWVPAAQVTPTELIPAMLRNGSLTPKDAAEAIRKLIPHVNVGSVYNAGARLTKTLIEKTEEGWKLSNKASAPVLFNGHVWGPSQVFQKYALAAHRRMVILHLLKAVPTGLMAMQLVEALERCGFCKAPINKDLVKVDLKVLEDQHQIRRVGNSGKWERV